MVLGDARLSLQDAPAGGFDLLVLDAYSSDTIPVHLLTRELADRARAERFLEELRRVDDATSFGGVRSSAERRGRWGGDAVAEGFIRLSAGCEHAEDLMADIAQALDATPSR